MVAITQSIDCAARPIRLVTWIFTVNYEHFYRTIFAAAKAEEILASRERRLPPFTFVSAYFAAFRLRPLPVLPENAQMGDNTLLMGLQALEAQDYIHAFTLINESIDQGISWDQGKALALNLRGTFKCAHNSIAIHPLLLTIKILGSSSVM